MIASLTSPASPIGAPQASFAASQDDKKLRATFDEFVGQAFFGQLMSSMRNTVGKPAYLHGGRAEEIFRGQLDQVLTEEMSDRSAAELTGPMYELFTLSRT